MNETNNSKAKLLFGNRIFRKYNWSEAEKVRVIETLDRARALREIKLVYATLEESYTGSKRSVKKGITEGASSRAGGSTKPDKNILIEGDELAARFKKLAGITS